MRTLLVIVALGMGVLDSRLLAQSSDQPQQPSDVGWPRQVDADGKTLLIYQPQIDVWDDEKLQADVALAVESQVGTEPTYGTATIGATTQTHQSSRTVTIDNIKVMSVQFPSAGDQRAAIEAMIQQQLP